VLRRALAIALTIVVWFGVLAVTASAGNVRHAALILDVNSGIVLHNQKGDELRHPASLTKMMTLYLTFETLQTGRLKMSDKISISESAASVAPSKLDLDPGDEISVADAIKALITKSANDIAVALAEKLGGSEANFVRLMNARARDIGMSKTHFENASGLPDDDQVTTARDMATLALHLQDDYPAYYPLFATRTFSHGGKTFRNHNTMLNNFAGVDGIKTGYTRASGFNLVTSVRRSGRQLVGVVFGGESAASRDGEMRALLTRMLTRASTVKIRKPMLLAKFRAEPMLALRPTAVGRRQAEVAEAAAPAPLPFAAATARTSTADAVDAATRESLASLAQDAETPVQIFKVHAVPIVPKARRAQPSPDETTDMDDGDRPAPADVTPSIAGDATARSDFGRFAATDGSTPAGSFGHTSADASARSTDETLITKSSAEERQPTPLDNQIAMLGDGNSLPPSTEQTASPVSAAAPVAFELPADSAITAAPAPAYKPAAKPYAKLQPNQQENFAAAPVMRGLPPSTLGAQAHALLAATMARDPAGLPPRRSAALQAATGRYEVQIGAFGSIDDAQRALNSVQGRTGKLLAGIASVTHPTVKDGHQMFRARFTGLDADRAAATCSALRRQSVTCLVMAGE